MREGLALILVLAASAAVAAEEPAPGSADAPAAVLDAAAFEADPVAVGWWRFRPGDDPGWAAPRFDDRSWERVEEVFRRGEPLPPGWAGIGWLRASIRVAPDLAGEPVALRLDHAGAAEVFLDGERIAAAGTVGPDAASTVPRYQQVPAVIVFERAGDHLLAVRFANHRVPAFLRAARAGGVGVTFSRAGDAIAQTLAESRFRNRSLGWFCGLFLAFGLLHLLLFAFHPAMRSHLDFALLCAVLAGLVFLLTYRFAQPDPRFLLVSEPVMNVLGVLFGIALLRFVYRAFYPRAPRLLAAFALIGLPVAVWGIADPAAAPPVVWLFMLAASVEVGRTVAVALMRRKQGARLLGAGTLCLAAGFGVGLLAYLGLGVPRNQWTIFITPFSSFMVLLVTMSIYLARHVATVHRELEARLVEVERLSAEKLEQERLRREQEVEKSILATRYEEKLRELEEARELQLAMLPRRLPELPDLEVAAHMETATEVGGDYYDFELDADGGLIVAIGDATGHGMRAGTMVAAAKALFGTLALEHPLTGILERSAHAIKRMNLRRLSMALLLARYRRGELRIAAAGMPPVFVYRAASGTVEQVLVEGIPLGAIAAFPYRLSTLAIGPGDAVLLMSDGLPERLGAGDEPLGYDRAAAAFAAAADGSAAELIDRLKATAEQWSAGRPADDDLTVVALKVRIADALARLAS